jgi:hypothetical protein
MEHAVMRIAGIGKAAIVVALCNPLGVLAQSGSPPTVPEGQAQPEEVIVVGQRQLLQLRTQMWEAEAAAYALFNRFNDEKRFDISCSMHQPTGTRINRQVCQPEFEIQAARGHAQDFFDGLGSAFDQPGSLPNGSIAPRHTPMASEILRQQPAYRKKIEQVAEEHPEFLDAIIRYSELREQHDAAIRSGE